MSQVFSIALALSFVVAAALPADVLVRKRVEADDFVAPVSQAASVPPVPAPADGATIEVWIDGDRIRRDEVATSFIVRPSDGVLYLVFHEARKYSRLPWPIPYEEYRSPFVDSLAESAPELLPFEGARKGPGAPVVVETLPADERTWSVSNGLGRRYGVVIDWTLTVPPGRARLLRALFALDHALSKLSNGGHSPLDPAASRPPVEWASPVRWLLSRQEPDAEIRYGERVLEIVADAAAPPGGYAPPAGYEEVPFDPGVLSRW